jgi:hypothetical protein
MVVAASRYLQPIGTFSGWVRSAPDQPKRMVTQLMGVTEDHHPAGKNAMSIRNLDRLFQPRSVAVIGASDNPQRIGTRVLANLLDGEFTQGGGKVWPLNPKHDAARPAVLRAGERAAGGRPGHHLHAAGHGAGPDQRTGAAGTKAAIVMTADPGHSGGRSLRQPMLEAARRTCCASSALAAWACNRRRWD